MGKFKISESEWQVMNVVWENAPVAAGDVVGILSRKRGWHSRTIRTLLDRLVMKGALKPRLDGKRYLYEPLITIQECRRQESQSFLTRVFGGKPVAMLCILSRKRLFQKKT
jgi:BlaI family penicillinase repressor